MPPPGPLELEEKELENLHDEIEEDHSENQERVEEIATDEKECHKRKSSYEMVCEKILGCKVKSANTFQREFSLDDVLDYVKTGVACIIEDEVGYDLNRFQDLDS